MLTPEQIQSARTQLGLNANSPQSTTPTTQGLKGSALSSWADTVSTPSLEDKTPLGSRIGNDFAKRGQNIVNQVDETRKRISDAGGGVVANIAGTGEVAGRVAGETAGAVINAGLETGKSLLNKLNGDNGEQLAKAGDSFMNATNVLGEKNSETLSKVGSFIKDGADNLPPGVVQGFKNFFNAIGLMGGGKLADIPVSDAVTGVKNLVSDTVSTVKDFSTSVKDAISGKVSSAFKGKTIEEILSTPENSLQKLSPTDRKVYFDAQKDAASQAHSTAQEQITQKASNVENTIKAESEKKISELQSQTQDLTNKADRASLEEAQSLKPKVIQSMKDNSQTYRDLVDKEISAKGDTPVKADELKQFIDGRYADNPQQASAIKDRLGLNEPSVKPPKAGEIPTIQTEASAVRDTTLRDIYEKTKSLKQDISAGAKKGTKSFTSDDKLTDDSISTLSDYMKSKGVDLSEANNFWRNYAPLRNKIINSIQPFTPRGAESATFKTFAKNIQKSVKGIDEGNKDFISATEKLLGTKIGNAKVRKALEALSTNEKAQIAEKIASDNEIAESKFAKDQATKEAKGNYTDKQREIDAKEFEANRKAQTRTNIWKTLKWGAGTAIGLEEFKRLTGI